MKDPATVAAPAVPAPIQLIQMCAGGWVAAAVSAADTGTLLHGATSPTNLMVASHASLLTEAGRGTLSSMTS